MTTQDTEAKSSNESVISLVKCLRNRNPETHPDCHAAADEIEQLRMANDELEKIAREAVNGAAEAAQAEIAQLRATIQWVVRDAAYKAPEQINAQMVQRWVKRLRSALADAAPEPRDG